ncbi:unnamed protein product, partial [Mesorhabditis belari]|uniref:RNA helicase n=1 Tax=Mesorhabditis belari TaxID=2138241 RepID=A0AAF3EXD9_9BILA
MHRQDEHGFGGGGGRGEYHGGAGQGGYQGGNRLPSESSEMGRMGMSRNRDYDDRQPPRNQQRPNDWNGRDGAARHRDGGEQREHGSRQYDRQEQEDRHRPRQEAFQQDRRPENRSQEQQSAFHDRRQENYQSNSRPYEQRRPDYENGGKAYGGNRESDFVQRRDLYQGGDRRNGYGGQFEESRSGGFGGPNRTGNGFGGDDSGDGRQGRGNDGGFHRGARDERGGDGGGRGAFRGGNTGGFGERGNTGGFGERGNTGGFGERGNTGGFGERGNTGGFGERGNTGGFERSSRGGFGGGSSVGGGFGGGGGRDGFTRGGSTNGGRGGFGSGGDYTRSSRDDGVGFSRPDNARGFSRPDNTGFGRSQNIDDDDNANGASKFSRGESFVPPGAMRTFERGGGGNTYEMGPRAPAGWRPDNVNVDNLYKIDQENVKDSIYGDDSEVTVDGSDNQDRFKTWESSPLDRRISLICKEKCGYPQPRNIQSAFIPQVLAGYDVLGQAETGSGKTAAFSLPIINLILQKKETGENKPANAPYALVLSPTRELTEQIYQQFKKFSNDLGIDVHRSYGQLARFSSVSEINQGCDILVGCIGRILDLIQKNDVSLKHVMFFVLDECDRLLSPKDLPDIMEIADKMPIPAKRQTLMMSATFTSDFNSIADKLINQKRKCTIRASNLNKKITHEFHKASGVLEKNQKMIEILQKEFVEAKSKGMLMPRTLIFVNRKLKAQCTAAEICKMRICDAESICADNDQKARNRIMKGIEDGTSRVLVGTDLCERGLDINNLDVVINFDMPPVADRYTHRTGRTGRNKPGKAYSIIDEADDEGLKDLAEIVKRVKGVGQEVPGWLVELADRRGSSWGGGGMRSGGFSEGRFGGSRGAGGGGGFGGGGFKNNGGFSDGDDLDWGDDEVVKKIDEIKFADDAPKPENGTKPTPVEAKVVVESKKETEAPANNDEW